MRTSYETKEVGATQFASTYIRVLLLYRCPVAPRTQSHHRHSAESGIGCFRMLPMPCLSVGERAKGGEGGVRPLAGLSFTNAEDCRRVMLITSLLLPCTCFLSYWEQATVTSQLINGASPPLPVFILV